jgi:hypothetical protein
MPIRQNEIFRNVDGEDVGTGLWVPDEKLETVPRLFSRLETRVDRKDVEEILSNPGRRSARSIFPSDKWILNQGPRGSCNGYACASALARARKLAGLPAVILSGEFVYAGINGGRDQGSMLDDGMEFLRDVGSVPIDMVPRLEYRWSRISEEAKRAAPRFRGFELSTAGSEDELSVGLALGFVGVVAVHFGGRMQSLDRNGVAGAHRGPGNNSVGVEDLRIRGGRYEFDYFNSHGRRYGEDGRAWLQWDRHLEQTSHYHQFFLVRAALDDPDDEQDLPPVA